MSFVSDTLDQTMGAVKNIINNLTKPFDTLDFVDQYKVICAKEYAAMLSQYNNSFEAPQYVHAGIGRYLAKKSDCGSLPIKRSGKRKHSNNVHGKVSYPEMWN